MRDMLDGSEPYPLTAWQSQFRRIRNDLEDALAREAAELGDGRASGQRNYIAASLDQFWDALDRVFALARSGNEAEARTLIRLSLQARQEALTTAVARLLVQNNETEQQAGERVRAVYARVERNSYIFVAAVLILILLTSLYVVSYNRRVFRELAVLSARRSELAQQVISTQENTLARDLAGTPRRFRPDPDGHRQHAAARRPPHVAGSGCAAADLREVQEIVQSTLEKVRSLSHSLHPVILDEIGFESALDQYLPAFEKQTGIEIRYERYGGSRELDPRRRNPSLSRHARGPQQRREAFKGARAEVRVRYLPDADGARSGRQRLRFPSPGKRAWVWSPCASAADLVNGRLELDNSETGGALVRLTVPVAAEESPCRSVASRFFWPTTTAWCAAGFGACWKTIRRSPSWAKPATGSRRSTLPWSCGPASSSWILRCPP